MIDQAGYGEAFCHRTGHNMGRETHGNGTHMDNLETHETRQILPQTLFTIEPGIYLPEFGVRSEIDVFIHRDGRVQVTGGPVQTGRSADSGRHLIQVFMVPFDITGRIR